MFKKFLNKLWLDKERPIRQPLKEKEKIDALKMLALPPVRDFLVATMDELVRGAIYLKKDEQIGAKYTIELLTDFIRKGDKIIKKEEKK